MHCPPRDAEREARHRHRLLTRYRHRAWLTEEIDLRLDSHLDGIRISPRHILDLSHGPAGAHLGQRYPAAQLTRVDTTVYGQQPIPAADLTSTDSSALASDTGCADLIYANLTLSRCDDLVAALASCHRASAPGGLFVFSAFGPATLAELRNLDADPDLMPPVQLHDLHDLGDQLLKSGFGDPVMDSEHLTITYPSLRKLLREVRDHDGLRARPGPNSPGMASSIRSLSERYPDRTEDGRYALSVEIVYGHAWRTALRKTADDSSPLAAKTAVLKRFR